MYEFWADFNAMDDYCINLKFMLSACCDVAYRRPRATNDVENQKESPCFNHQLERKEME